MKKLHGIHENFDKQNDVKVGSERGFGIIFAFVFLIIGLFPIIRGGELRLWGLGVSTILVALTFAFPSVLRPLNILWFRFGMVLHKIVNPLVMGFLFFFYSSTNRFYHAHNRQGPT